MQEQGPVGRASSSALDCGGGLRWWSLSTQLRSDLSSLCSQMTPIQSPPAVLDWCQGMEMYVSGQNSYLACDRPRVPFPTPQENKNGGRLNPEHKLDYCVLQTQRLTVA